MLFVKFDVLHRVKESSEIKSWLRNDREIIERQEKSHARGICIENEMAHKIYI